MLVLVVWVRVISMPSNLDVNSNELVIARSTEHAALSSPASKAISDKSWRRARWPTNEPSRPSVSDSLERLEIHLARVRRRRDRGDELSRHMQAPMAENARLADVEALGDDPDRQLVHERELNQVPLRMPADPACRSCFAQPKPPKSVPLSMSG